MALKDTGISLCTKDGSLYVWVSHMGDIYDMIDNVSILRIHFTTYMKRYTEPKKAVEETIHLCLPAPYEGMEWKECLHELLENK